jgi:hypothetical protein
LNHEIGGTRPFNQDGCRLTLGAYATWDVSLYAEPQQALPPMTMALVIDSPVGSVSCRLTDAPITSWALVIV